MNKQEVLIKWIEDASALQEETEKLIFRHFIAESIEHYN